MKTFELNNKQTIPAVGFGVFMIPNDGPNYDATLAALKAGYRHIDTAAGYCNESDVGKAIKNAIKTTLTANHREFSKATA